MKKITKIILLAFIPVFVFSQEEKKDFGIKFSGFVKYDANYDTRQTVNIREGHFLLYPDNILKDVNGKDINAKPNLNMLAIQSRLKGSIFGPDAWGAKTSGVIEADFFGNENTSFSDVNGFRLRHAFVKLNWTSSEFLAGQYWHPMFAAEAFPAVISFNTGAPFQPFSRNPQLRFTKKFGPLSAVATIFSQRDFQGTGPDGGSTKYLRNSGIPNINLQFQFKPDSTEHIFGLGVDYKIITPRLNSEVTITPAYDSVTVDTITHKGKISHKDAVKAKYVVDESLAGLSVFAFMKLKFKPVTVKLYGIYAQNAFDLTMIGGYGITKIVDPATGKQEYTNLSTMSVWTEIQTNGKKIQYGLFAGYTKNMAAQDSIMGTIYARGSNIDNIYRLAPRVVFIAGKLQMALELEYTVAAYGIANGNKKGGVTEMKQISNVRSLFSMIYNF